MLCRVPMRVTDTLDVRYGSSGGEKKDMGLTTEPTDTTPPAFNLSFSTEGSDCKVTCGLTPAAEGTNHSLYLGPGTYPTGLQWFPQYAGFSQTNGQNEVYGVVNEINSNRSRDAEVEHCLDWVRAHKITLEAAENAIRFATPGLENRRFSSRQAAYQGALDAFVAHSPHKQIAEIFKATILVSDRQFDAFPQIFKEKLLELFLDIGNQTAIRDQRYWHHFEFNAAPIPTASLSIMNRMKTSGRDYRNVQPSGSFSVGITSSETLINLRD